MHLKRYAVLCIYQNIRVSQSVDNSINSICCFVPYPNDTRFFASFFLGFCLLGGSSEALL